MIPEQAIELFTFLQPQLVAEAKTTRKVLAAVPEDKGDYKPHDNSMGALELARHIAFTDIWFLESILGKGFSHPDDSAFAKLSPSQVVAAYDAKVPDLIQRLKGLTGEQLAIPLKFYTWEHPAVVYLQFMMKHTVHHRGQLSAYLRPMGAKVPSIYGGSFDEPFTASAEA